MLVYICVGFKSIDATYTLKLISSDKWVERNQTLNGLMEAGIIFVAGVNSIKEDGTKTRAGDVIYSVNDNAIDYNLDLGFGCSYM